MPNETPPLAESSAHTDLAHSFGLITEQELAALTGCELGTLEAWRKRGKGPNYCILGTATLYLRASVADWIASETRHQPLRKSSL